MRYYLFVVGPDGEEIAGSRRSLDDGFGTHRLSAMHAELAARVGDDCLVTDNIDDMHAYTRFCRARSARGTRG